MSACLFLFAGLSVCLSVSVYFFVDPSVPVRLSVLVCLRVFCFCVADCLFVSLSLIVPTCLSVSLSLFLFVFLFCCLPVCFYYSVSAWLCVLLFACLILSARLSSGFLKRPLDSYC